MLAKEGVVKVFILNTLKNSNSERFLRLMHEVGVLGLLLPEYGRANCKVSYDFYHRYTADEHSLRMIRFLEELETQPNNFKKFSKNYEQLNSKVLLKLSTFIQPITEKKRSRRHQRTFENSFAGNCAPRLKYRRITNYRFFSKQCLSNDRNSSSR